MPNNVQSFIVNTLQPLLNDQNNTRFWLPGQLANLKNDSGHLVFPLTKLGPSSVVLTGSSGSFIAETLANDWVIAKNSQEPGFGTCAIPSPTSPEPTVTLSHLTVDGVPNVFLQPAITSVPLSGNNGYVSQATLRFNYYPSPQQALQVSGSYELSQAVCTCDPGGSACDGKHSDTVIGQGTFTANITDCYLDTTFQATISGKDTARAAQVAVTGLTVSGPTAGSNPTFSYSCLTLTNSSLPKASQNAVLNLAKQALESPQGIAGIVQAINGILSESSTTDALSQLMSNSIGSALDDIFGSVPPPGLPDDTGQEEANDLDLYLFDRARVAINNAASPFYLPWQIAASGSPVLDPYTISSLSIPDQTIAGVSFTGITLSNISIANVSNAVAPNSSLLLHSPVITAAFSIATLPAGPSRTFNRAGSQITMNIPPAGPAMLSGAFAFTMSGVLILPVSGTATISITGGQLTATIAPSGPDAASLLVAVQSLALDLSQATVTVCAHTGDSLTDKLAAKLLQSPSAVGRIADAINGQISGQLTQLSHEFTSAAKRIISQKLNGGTE